jgi:Domain of unknown function (DUF4160)
MKVGQYKGRRIAVLTRDEHCPPHVHLDGGDSSARFEFSFWHNGYVVKPNLAGRKLVNIQAGTMIPLSV